MPFIGHLPAPQFHPRLHGEHLVSHGEGIFLSHEFTSYPEKQMAVVVKTVLVLFWGR